MIVETTCPCGTPLAQPTHGRKRHYCSEPCRRAADTQRKAERVKALKPSQCALCGGPVIQPPTGRPRLYCDVCGPLVQQERSHKSRGLVLDPGYVYIFAHRGLYKIGFTHNVEQRRRRISRDAIIIWTIATHAPRRLERNLHTHFADKRVEGEYFALSKRDLQWAMQFETLFDGRLPRS